MVYVPILKIEIPEPRLEDVIPATVHLIIKTLTAIYDFADDLIWPLAPEAQQVYNDAVIRNLPREVRLARKKIFTKNITDPDKQSEEIEDAAFAFYRRRLREMVAGYTDEDTEDATFRRMLDPTIPAKEVWAEYANEQLEQLGPEAIAALASAGAERQRAAAVVEPSSAAAGMGVEDEPLELPRRARQALAVTAAGSAGLVLGAGVAKLLRLLTKRQRRQRQPGGAGGTGSRPSAAAAGGATAAGPTAAAQRRDAKPRSSGTKPGVSSKGAATKRSPKPSTRRQ